MMDISINGRLISRFDIRRTSTDDIIVDGIPRTIGHYQWQRLTRDGDGEWVAAGSGELDHYIALGAERLAQLILDDWFEHELARRMVVGETLRTLGLGAHA